MEYINRKANAAYVELVKDADQGVFTTTTHVVMNKHMEPPFVVGSKGSVLNANVLLPDGAIAARTLTIDEDGAVWIPTNWL